MRFGSCCSGIEAASVAWEPLGMKPAWFSEIEAFPSAVLAHHWPDVKNLGDMTKISRRVLLGEIEAPDVLMGGTPCQAFSVAGMREGMADERGQLTMKYVELANAIDTIRVRAGNPETVIVWENVPGVLSDKQNAFGCFLGALAGEDRELQPSGKKWTNAGCVYGPQRAIAWRVLDAQYFGVAQRRRRVFVVASARTDIDPAAVLFERESLRRDTPPRRNQGQDAAQDAGEGFTASSFGQYQPGVGTLRSQGGDIGGGSETIAIHPHCIGRAATAGPQGKEYLEDGAAYTCDARGVAQAVACTVALRGREGGATAELGGDVATALRASTGGGDKPHILTQGYDFLGTPASEIAKPVDCHTPLRSRTPGQFENSTVTTILQQNQDCIPEYYTHDYCDDRIYSAKGVAPALNFSQQHRTRIGYGVRRLTPTECERLQGFPDGHTAVTYRNKPAADGPRYKAIGNSMAVPCMAFIGSRLTAFMGVRHVS